MHLKVFEETLAKEETPLPPWHPIHILKEEHKILTDFSQNLYLLCQNLKEKGMLGEEDKEKLHSILHHLKESESHYLREENVLFPYLEKHRIKEPPTIMWSEHDNIRKIKKQIYKLFEERGKINFKEFAEKVKNLFSLLKDTFASHFYKENNILFPTTINVISREEFVKIREEFDEIGYCCFTPEIKKMPEKEKIAEKKLPEKEGEIVFETGTLLPKEIEAVLNSIPFDITFVDREDTVRYFNLSRERIFTRTKAVTGRKVQQCHPQKSVPIVDRILKDFKIGRRDVAEFWINLNERLIHICYFPVRDEKGNYLGCREVTQDITEIKKIEGERRIYEEEK